MSTSTTTYYGGSALDLGNVKRLPQTTFDAFIKEVLGHPVPVNVTRAEFAALPKDRRNQLKRVAYFVPAAFKTNPSPRLYEHATVCHLVALDVDDPKQAAPFFHNPDNAIDALDPWPCAIYTTASHTPEAPRLRVVVAAEGLPMAQYREAANLLARRLGLPNITKESKVSVQPMYLPVMFKGDDADTMHPLIGAEPLGVPMKVADLQPGAEQLPSAGRGDDLLDGIGDGGDISEDLEFLRPTLDDITIEDVKEALDHLDPDCPYPEWLEIAAALKHQFTGEQAEEAYELFDEWSAGGTKYVSPEDTAAKWKSLRPQPKGRAPVTVRSLFHRATAAGWSSAKVASRCFSSTMEWISDPVRTANDLLAQGVKRIVATPLLSPLERGTLLTRLQDVLKAKGHKVSRSDMQKELHHLERIAARANQSDVDKRTTAVADKQLPPWARGICYVARANEFFQRSTGRVYNPEVLDNVYSFMLMPVGTVEGAETGRPTMRPRDFLLNVARIPRVDYYHYDPAHPEDSIVADGKRRYVNTYLPTYPEPTAEQADAAGALFSSHLENLVAEPAYRRTLLDFLCFMVQCPGEKIRWAVLLQGAQGCGKTFLADAMRAVLGVGNVTTVDASLLLTSPFNGWATGAQLVAMEEVRVVGHNRYEVMNRLKPCITNSTITINRKYTDLTEVPNNANYIMFTNHHDSLAVQDGDRRYFVVNSRIQSKSQVKSELGIEYFQRLYDMLATNAGGLRAWMERHKLSPDFKPDGHAPETKYLADLTVAASSPLSLAVNEAIEDGDHPLIRSDIISLQALRRVLETTCEVPSFTDQALSGIMRELGFAAAGRIRLDGEKHRIWTKSLAWLNNLEGLKAECERRQKQPDASLGFDDIDPTAAALLR